MCVCFCKCVVSHFVKMKPKRGCITTVVKTVVELYNTIDEPIKSSDDEEKNIENCPSCNAVCYDMI